MGVHGNPFIIFPKPNSIYLRGTITPPKLPASRLVCGKDVLRVRGFKDETPPGDLNGLMETHGTGNSRGSFLGPKPLNPQP